MQVSSMGKHGLRAGLAALALGMWSPETRANDYLPDGERAADSPYAAGRVRVGIGGGSDRSDGHWNIGLSVALGYFVVDNLELGGDFAVQFGEDPFAAQLGPAIRYFLPITEEIHPYLGAFYRHWFFSRGVADLDTVGARAGLILRQGPTFFGLGLVYEVIISTCEDGCVSVYPELGLSVLF